MAYELYVLPVPHGGDAEESGEALLALIRDGLLRLDPSRVAHQRMKALLDGLAVSGAGLDVSHPQDGVALLASAWGLEIVVTTRYVRFRVPFTREGESARKAFDTVFDLLARIVQETGWAVYDPQDASQVPPSPAGLAATLDIYLSVMDQLRPGAGGI